MNKGNLNNSSSQINEEIQTMNFKENNNINQNSINNKINNSNIKINNKNSCLIHFYCF